MLKFHKLFAELKIEDIFEKSSKMLIKSRLSGLALSYGNEGRILQ
ncbi:hypothetical protein AMURIS_05151 [Acetatifactor muris]|uniref:Uncharacterized protein n=1 Tax=Acetatifactor muris TaxID=879566 RepID=A0A2K4ZPV9_9FIRM|nr:hypothetical protein AMURIS_05151 [Acetatifactor muris]